MAGTKAMPLFSVSTLRERPFSTNIKEIAISAENINRHPRYSIRKQPDSPVNKNMSAPPIPSVIVKDINSKMKNVDKTTTIPAAP